MNTKTSSTPSLRITIDVQYDLAEGESIEFVQQYLQSSVDTIVGDGFLTAHHNIDSEVEEYNTNIAILDESFTKHVTLQDLSLEMALAEVLSDWPEELSDKEILDRLRDDEMEGISAWEPFEDYDGIWLAEHIQLLARSFLWCSRAVQNYSLIDTGKLF